MDSQVPGLLWGWPTPRGADATGVASVCPAEHVRWAAHVAAVLRADHLTGQVGDARPELSESLLFPLPSL